MGVAGWRQRQQRGVGAAALALAAWMALKHIRHGSIFAVLWIAYVPAWVTRTAVGAHLLLGLRRQEKLFIPLAKTVFVASLTFALVHRCWLPTLPGTQQYSSICYPTDAVEYLKQTGFRGNLLTPFHAGAYVSWILYPDVLVSLDGRYEVAYAPGVLEEHDRFYGGGLRWWEVLERYPVDAILVPQEARVRPLLGRLAGNDGDSGAVDVTPVSASANAGTNAANPTWRRVYEDASYVVLARDDLDLPVVLRPESRPVDAARTAFSAPAHANRDGADKLHDERSTAQ
jgi:hypothetical protein